MNIKVALFAAGVVGAVLLAARWAGGPVVGEVAPPPQVAAAAPQMIMPQAMTVALPVAADAVPAGEPALPNYVARKLKVFEGHWQGMDGRLLTDELASKLNYPRGLQGVLLGEVTLNAAATGLLGGDVIVMIEDMPVTSMEGFQAATREVANRSEARVTVLRKDNRPGAGPAAVRSAGRRQQRWEPLAGVAGAAVLRKLTMVVRAEGGLGFAQLEGAPMILPGDPRPHGYRGPCTECHPVGQGFELTPDPDLISLPPPAITREVAAQPSGAHESRGPCEACHVIK